MLTVSVAVVTETPVQLPLWGSSVWGQERSLRITADDTTQLNHARKPFAG